MQTKLNWVIRTITLASLLIARTYAPAQERLLPEARNSKDLLEKPKDESECERKRARATQALDSVAAAIKQKWDTSPSAQAGIGIENTRTIGGSSLPEEYRKTVGQKAVLAKMRCEDLDKWLKEHGLDDESLDVAEGKAQY